MRLSYKGAKLLKIKVVIILILIVIFFLALNLTSFAKEVKNFFYLISSPIQKSLWRAGERVSDFFEPIIKAKNLKSEVEKLKLKNQELLFQNTSLKELEKENKFLREALGIELQKEFKLVLAQVIGKDISQDFILIDRGAKDGILEGQPVITRQKVLIGRVSQVYKNFSKVILISNPKSSFDGKIPDEGDELFGRVQGKGNLRILFDLIPKEKEIQRGDLVQTSALAGIFPAGLLVGEIQEVRKSDLEPFQIAEIQPGFNIGDLEKLFIITEW